MEVFISISISFIIIGIRAAIGILRSIQCVSGNRLHRVTWVIQTHENERKTEAKGPCVSVCEL